MAVSGCLPRSGDKGERDPFVVLEHPVVRVSAGRTKLDAAQFGILPWRLLWIASTDRVAHAPCHAQVLCGHRHANGLIGVRRGFCANLREHQRRESRTPYLETIAELTSRDGGKIVALVGEDRALRRKAGRGNGAGEADEHEGQNGLTDGVVKHKCAFHHERSISATLRSTTAARVVVRRNRVSGWWRSHQA